MYVRIFAVQIHGNMPADNKTAGVYKYSPLWLGARRKAMPVLKKQRIDLRLNEDDKNMIEEAAAMTNQSISQFMVSTAS